MIMILCILFFCNWLCQFMFTWENCTMYLRIIFYFVRKTLVKLLWIKMNNYIYYIIINKYKFSLNT